ncbi:MAG: GNAT family N-acetyltransferase [Anaerolineaceae bacterium]|nr:GNAT family N-acetyltransferase [Anaerolineaceae bacterium]
MTPNKTHTYLIDASQITIRPMVEADLPALEWDGEYSHFRKVYAQHFRSMENGNTMIWVADSDSNGPIGQLFILLYSQKLELADGIHRAYIFSFRIKPEYRNHGLGTFMLSVAESDLKARGFTTIRLNVARTNLQARRLYEKLGYKIFGSDPGLWSYQDQHCVWQTIKEPAWKMLKLLT